MGIPTLSNDTAKFARGSGLNKLMHYIQEVKVSQLNPNPLVFICDVDFTLTDMVLNKIRRNTNDGQIYYPIFFSQLNPAYSQDIVGLDSPLSQQSFVAPSKNIKNSEDRKLISKIYSKKQRPYLETQRINEMENLQINENNGFWRFFSYGMASMYLKDFQDIGGYNDRIIGWGKEDLEFVDATIKHKKQIFKTAEEQLFHRYHEKYCNDLKEIDMRQFEMCEGSRKAHYSSNFVGYLNWLNLGE